MSTYLYMNAFPEALVASMLAPEDFAPYVAVGSRKQAPGRAMFIEVDPALFSAGHFDLSLAQDLKPHPDGTPKHTTTLSIYRVLEHIPMEAFGRLFVVTRDGKSLDIEPREYTERPGDSLRLYQELCPVQPTVLSKLQPEAFGRFITDPNASVHVPKILFTDLLLGQIGDPDSDVPVCTLPYAEIGLVRDAVEILRRSERQTLVVDRTHSHDFFYRTVQEGFFLSDGTKLLYYPFLSPQERETTKHDWWRSAELS